MILYRFVCVLQFEICRDICERGDGQLKGFIMIHQQCFHLTTCKSPLALPVHAI